MTLAWTDFPDAPAPGAFVCSMQEIPAGGVLSLSIDRFPVLVVQVDGIASVFVNACPHQFLPLDQRSTSLLSADGTRLMCSNHQAEFDLETGTGKAGFGLGCALSRVPVQLRGGGLYVLAQLNQ